MKKLVFVCLGMAAFGFFSTSAAAQKATRISFARGATEKVVSGSMSGFASKRKFVIRVKAGQVLTTENAGENPITISLKAPKGSTYEQDMAADCHDKNEVDPTAAGDYVITVTECRKADRWRGRFRFRVRVE